MAFIAGIVDRVVCVNNVYVGVGGRSAEIVVDNFPNFAEKLFT